MHQLLRVIKILALLTLLAWPTATMAQHFLVSPANGTTNMTPPVTLQWEGPLPGLLSAFWLQVDDDPGFGSLLIDIKGTTAKTYVLNSLDPAKTYYWRLNAYHNYAGIWIGWTAAWSFSAACPTPAPPTPVTPSNGATDIERPVYFDWSDVADIFNYQIQVDDNSDFSSPEIDDYTTSSEYTSEGLSDGTQYYWRVRDQYLNVCGWGDWSSTWDFTTCALPGQSVLASPADNAEGVETPVLLDWEDVTLADYYHVLADDDFYFGSPEVDIAFAAGPSEYSASGLADNTIYYWKVMAYNSCGDGDWSTIWKFKTGCPPAESPALLTPYNASDGHALPVTFNWELGDGDAGYRIQIDTDPGFASPVYDYVMGYTGTFEALAGLDEGVTYYWRVMAENSCGWSEWSADWSFTMACPVPGMPTLLSPSDAGVDISRPVHLDWEDVTDAVYYHVQIDDDPAFASIDVDYEFPAGPSEYYVAGLSENMTYYWKVQAMSGCDQGEWCTACSFTTGAEHICGDVDVDGNVNILDIVYTINYIYKNGPEPCNPPKR